jgi:hypothetical protein
MTLMHAARFSTKFPAYRFPQSPYGCDLAALEDRSPPRARSKLAYCFFFLVFPLRVLAPFRCLSALTRRPGF